MPLPRPLAAALLLLLSACTRAPEPPPYAGPGAPPQGSARAGYAGSTSCAACHPLEAQKFAQSDHHKAMALPTPQTVKGDFNHATLAHLGVTSAFETEGGRYFVTTQGPEGKPVRYEVAYTFGHFPLQQYLVHFPGGRLQCLPLAYDTRDKKDGGQRWFHLYGDDKVAPGDPLFWAGPMQNWNHMCAACHSTALEKGYDEKTDSFRTTWSEMTLSCESCHGPAQGHLQWTQTQTADAARGFAQSVVDRKKRWVMDPATGIAKRQGPPPPAALVDACMRCHARADVLDEKADPTAPLCEARRPALLEENLYRGTGEIQDEVYEWGSFTQSRMSHAGVTCADCHDPHTGKRVLPGNMLCAQCHLPAKFDAPAHHGHAAGSAGAQCTACHMPGHTYMGVDKRHDHGFRVPRPDLTAKWGADIAPNSCAACHAKPGQDAAWAAAQILKWNGGKAPRASFADALCAGRAGVPQAGGMLAKLAQDGTQPGVARATALRLLAQNTADAAEVPRLDAAVRNGLADADPFVRANAAGTLDLLPPESAAALGVPALADPAKVVRLSAARALAPLAGQLPAAGQAALDKALAEARAAESVNADRAEGQLNLGSLAMAQGKPGEADARFAAALARNPSSAMAWANRADLLRAQGDEAGCEKMLREGLQKAYDKAPLHHALGLAFIRQKQLPRALAEFEKAAAKRPEVAQHALLLALVRDAMGDTEDALQGLRLARLRSPHDRSLLNALVELAQKAGHGDEAKAAADLLAQWR